jgi:succinyl-CoA synthetase beta subunit
MNIHEYQAKQLFIDYQIPILPGKVAFNPEQAKQNAQELGGNAWMVKAQVHAGGRGKAGGIKKATRLAEVGEITQQFLGSRLVTHQTGHPGKPIHSVLIETTTEISCEYYLSLLLDRAEQRLAVIASRAGGMDIETIAAQSPEQIVKQTIDPIVGIQAYQCREIAFALQLDAPQRQALQKIITQLYQLVIDKDLSLVEINPLIATPTGELFALDAKINVDDNALYRQKALAAFYDATQEDEKEHQARQFDLNYIALDGNIACMVNGAGLAMATMDVIKMQGGEPANFLDVGGGTTADKVEEAFKIILSDTKVKAILVNIFGGIVRCDLIAEGIIAAIKQTQTQIPVVVRLEGTHVEEGKALLKNSQLSIISADNLDEAAQKVVNCVC